MEHSLSLVFITSNGSKASITIQDVRDVDLYLKLTHL